MSEVEQENRQISIWTTNRRIHDWAMLFCMVLFLAAFAEAVLLADEPGFFLWAVAAAIASGWAANRMHKHVQFADFKLHQIRQRQKLHAVLDDAFEKMMERRGVKPIQRKRAA